MENKLSSMEEANQVAVSSSVSESSEGGAYVHRLVFVSSLNIYFAAKTHFCDVIALCSQCIASLDSIDTSSAAYVSVRRDCEAFISRCSATVAVFENFVRVSFPAS